MHRSLLRLKRTVKIWGTFDTFTQKCCFSYLCLFYATAQKGKWNKDVFALLYYLPPPRAASIPSLGRNLNLPFSREMLHVQERQAKGTIRSVRWQQKTRAGQIKERWWQARDKRRANLETAQHEGPAVRACFCQLRLHGLQKPGWEGTLLIKSDAYNHGEQFSTTGFIKHPLCTQDKPQSLYQVAVSD